MKTLLLFLLAQVTITEGRVGTVTLDPLVCSRPLHAFGTVLHCRPDNTLILAVPMDCPTGPSAVTKKDDGQPVAIVEVDLMAWPTKHRRARNVPPAPAGRLESDRLVKEQAFSAYDDSHWVGYHARGPFLEPLSVPYRITDSFGLRRLYGTATEPELHIGTDMAAPKPGAWDVRAPDALAVAGGVVVLAADLWDSGKTVIIFHGDGISVAYYYLDSLTVHTGDLVTGGATLGKVGGSTEEGQTGKHLHLVMRVNGIAVDPLEGIATLNGSLR